MNIRARHLTLVTSLLWSAAGALTLSSPDVRTGGRMAERQVLRGFGCAGQNISPALRWTGAPAGTRSYALTLYDPDAPSGSGWWHWVVYDLPAGTSSLGAGAGDMSRPKLPAGAVQGRTDFGTAGYGGPCPPKGDPAHRYIFSLYALNVPKLEVPRNASAALIGFTLRGHTLAKATLTARYGR